VRYVNRWEVDNPVSTLRAVAAREDAERYFAASKKHRSQSRHEFDPRVWLEAKPALTRLFARKCAFCESPVANPDENEVVHFRPPNEIASHASSASSMANDDGYWWLAYSWENLYLACRECAQSKRNAFPIAFERAAPQAVGDALQLEGPMLLDPCGEDDPDAFLDFDPDFKVRPLRPVEHALLDARVDPEERALATIDAFALNRSSLIEQRRHIAEDESWVPKGPAQWSARTFRALRAFLGAGEQSHTAFRRWMVRRYVRTHQTLLSDATYRAIERALLKSYGGLIALSARRATAVRAGGSADIGEPARAHRKKRPHSMPAAHAWYLRRIEIENYRVIGRLAFDIVRGTGSQVGWSVLLGENGTGKSTVLEAIAMALMGATAFKKSGQTPAGLLRRLAGGRLAKSGCVILHWTDRATPWTMRFTSRRVVFEGEPPPRALVIRGYGATRRLPTAGMRTRNVDRQRSAANLFNPFVPVCDANRWLTSLPNPRSFDSAALALKDLLSISMRSRIRRRKGRVWLTLNGVDVTLEELSDGFQSVLVLATDIMTAVMGQAHDLRFASGIVLVDELDAHLHPTWKMRIVQSLRRTFPGLQFIATTHEPLCLRGVLKGEPVLIRKQGRSIEAVIDLPSPEGLRVDQLLTSAYFGLHSTLDPAIDQKFRQYYSLLARQDELSRAQRSEADGLGRELAELGRLGFTPRDRLAYEVIDQFLATENRYTPEEAADLREETKAEVARRWSAARTGEVTA
jgi:hypothetical protein